MNDTNELVVDVVVIGGGQAGLSASYYLRKSDLDFVILDAQRNPGGAWQRGWNSLRLFSPAEYSSLPGRQMPPSKGDGFPTRIEVLNYLEDYENRYRLPIERPVRVQNIEKQPNALRVQTDNGTWLAKAVISATGTWSKPYIPHYDGAETFRGQQLHSAEYVSPEGLTGKSILIIGGGNSGAQIYAELSRVAGTIWAKPGIAASFGACALLSALRKTALSGRTEQRPPSTRLSGARAFIPLWIISMAWASSKPMARSR